MNLYNGNVLNFKLIKQLNRREFNPADPKDREEFKFFLQKSKWRSGYCPFALEFPFDNIPVMIHDKLSRHTLKV